MLRFGFVVCGTWASIVIAESSHVSVASTPMSLLGAGSFPVGAVPLGGDKSRLALD